MRTLDYHSVRNQRICEQLVRREVIYCVSSLVHELAQHTEADYYDDVLSLLQQTDYETPAREHIEQMSREELASALDLEGEPVNEDDTDEDLRLRLVEFFDERGAWDEFCNALRIEPHENEAYEHWIVSSYFAEKLRERGEMVGEVLGLTIWGRCTTGQAIYIDSVIGEIAAEMEILEGQANEWKD